MKTLLFSLLLFAQLPAPTTSAQADYVLGPGDVLMITVAGEPDLTNKYTVEPDGTFDFPWLGRVSAGGMALRGLEDYLAKRLIDGTYLNKAQVGINVQEFRSQYVWVQGQVGTPGMVPLTGLTTLAEVLAKVVLKSDAGQEIMVYRRKGGPRDSSAPIRPDDGEDVVVIKVQKSDILSGRAGRERLENGDTIHIPKAVSIFVTGEVKSPNSYVLEGELNVLQAVALAGGLTDRGSMGKVKIQWTEDGKQKERNVKASDKVKPGDTIIVGKRWF
jgi:polysaccharide export outer membrane protein